MNDRLDEALAAAGFAVELFDRLPDVVFFAKDGGGRYRAVNETLVRRLACGRKDAILGRTAAELFPPPLGERYLMQDLGVCASGRELAGLLELHLYPDGSEGWCVTEKLPLRAGADVIGLAGISRDVAPLVPGRDRLDGLAIALEVVQARFVEPLRVDELAALAGMSGFQLTRRVRALFGITPRQLVIKTRVDAARRMLLETGAALAEIALACGWADQSAFTRQFRAAVGITPAQYRSSRRR